MIKVIIFLSTSRKESLYFWGFFGNYFRDNLQIGMLNL